MRHLTERNIIGKLHHRLKASLVHSAADARRWMCRCSTGMQALEMAQQLHRKQSYNPDCPLDVCASELLLLEMAGRCRPAGHDEVLQQTLSAGRLHGPAFTQEYARSPCFRALHQPTYVDMIKPQAFANTLCKTADSSVCMACQHLLVRNSGSSILCVVWKLDELINRASLREALALRRVKVTQKALKNSYRPIFKGPAKRQGTIYTYYLNLLFKPSQVSMVTKFYSTLAGAWQLRLPLHSADTSLASLEHHVQFRSRCRVLMTVHLDDITGCRKC